MAENGKDITTLLGEVQHGDREALARLWELIESEVRAIANHLSRLETGGQRVPASAIVNEVYWRLFPPGAEPPSFENRAHFFGAAARAIRRTLVDDARSRRRRFVELDLDGVPDKYTETASRGSEEGDLEALDRALREFERDEDHARKARIVHLRFFAGRTIEEIGGMLQISTDTVKRDLRFARSWLKREIRRRRRR